MTKIPPDGQTDGSVKLKFTKFPNLIFPERSVDPELDLEYVPVGVVPLFPTVKVAVKRP